jgi:small subunit ribosomal protein S1
MDGNEKEEKSFAELFEASLGAPRRRFVPGDTVTGVVADISKDTLFVDLGGKSEGMAAVEEFLDKDGNVTIKKGEQVELRVSSIEDGIHLSKGMKIQGAQAMELLREAHRSSIPIEGRVSGVNKGGFDIDISGIRSFCPIGQIDLQFCERPEEHVGQRYLFRIMEIKERGKNIVLSRRALLQEEQEQRAKETLEKVIPGAEFDGKVTKLMAFGAFVDIGGIEGMVHVSEISHARIDRPSEVLQQGQDVRVRVINVEPGKGGRPKISLSIKALEPDAWEKGLGVKEGEIIRGKVSRVADFGAFVTVAPGVEGLVHVSEISYERITHPKKVLREGEAVEVLIQRIDYEKRRISLSIKEALFRQRMQESGEGEGQVTLQVGQILKGIVEDIKPYGLFVRLPQLGSEARGLLPNEELIDQDKRDVKKKFPRGREIQVEIVSIDEKGRIRLSQKAIEAKEDRESYSKFMEEEGGSGTLGTFGDIFNNLKLKEEEE